MTGHRRPLSRPQGIVPLLSLGHFGCYVMGLKTQLRGVWTSAVENPTCLHSQRMRSSRGDVWRRILFVAAQWSQDFLSPADPASEHIKATCCLETALSYWHQKRADISAKATIQMQMNCAGFDFYTTGPIPYPPIVSAFHGADYF